MASAVQNGGHAEIMTSDIRIWPYLIALGLLSYFILSAARSYWRIKHIPGPWITAFTDLWYIRAITSGKTHLDLSDLCDKYGPIARIGPNKVVTCDGDLYRKINAARSPFPRSDWYKAFKFDADRENLVSEIDEGKHTRMRTKVSAGYFGKENPDFERSIDTIILNLVNLIERKYLSEGSQLRPVDFAEKIQYFTLDVISSLSLSHPFGFVSADRDMYDYIHTMENNYPVMNFFSSVPFLRRIMEIPWVQEKALPTVKDRTGMGKMKGVARDLISRRFGDDKEVRQDMTGSFIAHGMSQAEIADESMLQVLAGSDTTATTMRSGLAAIISNPRIYARLKAECIGAEVPTPSVIPHGRALELPYLQACVKEALRHNPPATGLMPKMSPPEGDTHNGIYIPAGVEIGVCMWNLHRKNTAIFGEDAALFRPERWLEASPEQLSRMEKNQELVFGYGRFRCMGERIAKVEIIKTVFELIRRFEWSFVDPMKVWERNTNYGIFIQKGMWLRVSKNQH